MKVLLIALIIVFAGLQLRLWFGDGSIQEVWRLRSQVDASRHEVMELTQRNQALAAEVADLKSGIEAIEERARADLGMVGEGESFFQFVREQRTGGSSTDQNDVAGANFDEGTLNNDVSRPVPGATKP